MNEEIIVQKKEGGLVYIYIYMTNELSCFFTESHGNTSLKR